MNQTPTRPDYIFEVSWEVCNKVGGIHTVITSKTLTLTNEWDDHLIMIGPDTWKGPEPNPEFLEDQSLFPSWSLHAEKMGLKIKTGRWKITGNPIVILVDFTPFFSKKDDIFKNLWLQYKVDSLTGGWDYIEPALFGYAAAKVIECFYHHHLTFSDKIVAQFHEWITGVGILYLNEHVPQIGTVFTTHATVVGRCIAGNGLPLYSKFNSYNAEQEARSFDVTAKHSLEKMAAATADCFTTVSEITAKECEKFLEKKPDILTPNGFDDFIVPDTYFFKEKRTLARKKLFKVAEALFGYTIKEDSLLLLKSGRYEFKNKGIDIFIDTLGELQKSNELKKDIIAFICIPAHSTGPKKDLLDRMDFQHTEENEGDNILTHYLQGAESDLILNRIKQNDLKNEKDKKVKVVFVPVYLSGNDGIFDLSYYELLLGFDLSAFPSYYEPWGYTPLESLAFHIPTITTNLTGFGMIVHSKSTHIGQGISVIERNDNNDKEAIRQIKSNIIEFTLKTEMEVNEAREAAYELSKTATWKNFIVYYKKAYGIALDKASCRSLRYNHENKIQSMESCEDSISKNTEPIWRKMVVQSQVPMKLKALEKIAGNLWWSWNTEAIELFEMMDKETWKESENNPIVLLETISFIQLKKLEGRDDFMKKLESVNQNFETYLTRKIEQKAPLIAYFCMEYGLIHSLKIYSGGLGILAGDFLKEASDCGMHMIGLGLLYHNGYFQQEISMHGEQISLNETQEYSGLPLHPVFDKNENILKIGIAFPGRTLYAKAWRVDIGISILYLLDCDIPENRMEDRSITGNLYGGNWENRLKQELLLGIGGMRLLHALQIQPEVFHFNEGHAAFAGLERLQMLVQEENISFETALEIVRASTLFTTHTPVPAGHDVFSEELLRIYLSYHANLLNISWKKLMALGRMEENNEAEKFSMSLLAARMSQKINGVSQIHERVTRKIFSHLWPGYTPEEISIGHITNGIHFPTWISAEWQTLLKNSLGNAYENEISEIETWKKINDIPDKNIWETHLKQKKNLLKEVKNHIRKSHHKAHKNIQLLIQHLNALNEKVLIIGFARRFVPYKRSFLLFSNPEKLSALIKKSKTPILFLFAGKAHPNDYLGQSMIKQIIEISKEKSFIGHVIFLENYDLELAKMMTSGVDVWLNLPEIELEASGTSGMKAAMNGVLNFSTLDGWYAEAYSPDMGWTLPPHSIHDDKEFQNEMDSEALYQIIEHEILPLYEDKNKEDIPVKWVAKIKNAFMAVGPKYNSYRLLKEYNEMYYLPLQKRNKKMRQNAYVEAKNIAQWKNNMKNHWQDMKILFVETFDTFHKPFLVGSELKPKVVLALNSFADEDIGVEMVLAYTTNDSGDLKHLLLTQELMLSEQKEGENTYTASIPIAQAGVYEYGFRIFPKNTNLTDRNDFPYIQWI